jgi:hypothetical protein
MEARRFTALKIDPWFKDSFIKIINPQLHQQREQNQDNREDPQEEEEVSGEDRWVAGMETEQMITALIIGQDQIAGKDPEQVN